MNLDWAAAPKKEENNDEKIQGSEAWLGWRNKGLGGSDSPALLGWSKWKTTEQLYLEKIGKYKQTFGPAQQSAMDRGKRLEPVIRDWYEKKIGAKFSETIEEYVGNPLIRVSYDGINREFKNEDGTIGRLIEIKTANAKDHAAAKCGEIPNGYIPQLQHELLVSGLSCGDYISYGHDDTYAVIHFKEDAEMQKEILRRANMMLDCMSGKREFKSEDFPPWKKLPKILKLDLSAVGQLDLGPTPEAQNIEGLVAECLLAKDASEQAEAKYEALKAKLKAHLGEKEKMEAGEAVFGYTERKGNVDYKKIPQLAGIDTEPFRGPPTRAFYFKRISK